MSDGVIVRVSGPLVVAEGVSHAHMYDVVHVSHERLIGEIIELRGKQAYIQVYEDTAGLAPGDPVTTSGRPMTVDLGPGLLTSIYDGIQRPLDALQKRTGDLLTRGAEAPALDPERRWAFEPLVRQGDEVRPGDAYRNVQGEAVRIVGV